MSFTARFNSLCAACEEWIREGDQIAVTSTGSVHDECVDSPRVSEPIRPACSTCWQVPASNGLCGCSE